MHCNVYIDFKNEIKLFDNHNDQFLKKENFRDKKKICKAKVDCTLVRIQK